MSTAGGYRVLSSHTGEEYERGDTYRARGLNEPEPGIEPEPDTDASTDEEDLAVKKKTALDNEPERDN
jgi:hypothetical protein